MSFEWRLFFQIISVYRGVAWLRRRIIPSFITDAIYSFVAQNHIIFFENETCRLPTAAVNVQSLPW
jgi:predicted DCC family thiol-disulfide oxidoreductase YuxK